MQYLRRYATLAAVAFAVAGALTPLQAQKQAGNPCPQEAGYKAGTDDVGNASDETADAASKAMDGATKVGTSYQKMSHLWKKPSSSTSTTAAATPAPATTQPAAQQLAKNNAPAAASNPCSATGQPASKPAAAAATAGTASKPAANAPAPGITPSITPIPGGQYVFIYSSSDKDATKNSAIVTKLSAGSGAGSDGVYTDKKNIYIVTDGKMTITPINNAPK
jgi:hypothetical protein